MSKISISVSGKDYDINLDGDFAERFEKEFEALFKGRKKLEIKDILWAYVQKSYDNYLLELEIDKQSQKLEEIFKV